MRRSRFEKPFTYRLRTIVPGVVISLLIAVVLTLLVHNWLAIPQYHLNAEQLLLTQADVGSQFTQTGEGFVGPTQNTISPLPYQQQMIVGRLREFMANSVLSPQGQQQIGDWERHYSFQPTNPPTIMGPFVADHSGIFDVVSVVRSFQTEDAARQEFHCCHYVDQNLNFDEYHTVPIHLGDEADGWTGISKSLTGPDIAPKMPTDSAYQELGYAIHWRHGPIVTNVAVWGAHDVTLAEALRVAQRVDAHIVQALQSSAKEGFHANIIVDSPSAGARALCAADRRTYADLHWH